MEFYPALKYKIFTPFYDRFIGHTMPEKEIKNRVLDLSEISKGQKILDFGCGTGTLIYLGIQRNAQAEFVGLEVDPEMVEIARNKEIAGASLVLCDSGIIPFPDCYFDRVISTWVFHHLIRTEKIRAFKEIKRVLRPDGKFVLADWGRPSNFIQSMLFFILQIFDTFNQTVDNVNGEIPSLLDKSGFMKIEEVGHRNTLFGTLRYWVCA
jgi:ubiquinone/menaquinone biosynthesis C-methylase UbiE